MQKVVIIKCFALAVQYLTRKVILSFNSEILPKTTSAIVLSGYTPLNL